MSFNTPEFLDRLQLLAAGVIPRHSLAENSNFQADGPLLEACQYVLSPGGKYIRPVLALCAARACASKPADHPTDAVITALELVHTYSLIHDDLPAMDNDALRRGRPTLHVTYDEATAILVGDGLQARAFEVLATAPGLTAEQRIQMVGVLGRAAGLSGMVGGQFVDIQCTNSDMSLEELQQMHLMKTGLLIQAALTMGAIAVNATRVQLSALDTYGANIGLAFQVIDDILDVEADSKTLGKTAGKDQDANKPTYVKLLGLEGAKAEAQRLLQAALDALEDFGESADHLRDLARYIVERDR